MDLDQALHIERRGPTRLPGAYAIADVAAFVEPGGADRRRGAPPRADALRPRPPRPAAPAGPLRGRRQPAARPGPPGPAVEHRPRRRRRGHPGRRRAGPGPEPGPLDYPRCRRRSTPARPRRSLVLLKEVGQLRLERERERGGVSLPLPEQEVVTSRTAGWSLATARCCRSRTGTRRSRSSPAWAPPRSCCTARSAWCGPCPHPTRLRVDRLRRTAAGCTSSGTRRRRLPGLRPLARPEHARRRRDAQRVHDRCCAARATSRSTAAYPSTSSTPRSPTSTPMSPHRCVGSSTGMPARWLSRCARTGTSPTGCGRGCATSRRRWRRPTGSPTSTSAPSSTWSRRACSPVGSVRRFTGVVTDIDEKDKTEGVLVIQDPAVEAKVVSLPGCPAARCRGHGDAWPKPIRTVRKTRFELA